jgi:azurin
VDLWIASDGDELKFVPERLECTEQERVRLHFHHRGTISSDPHDWVLLRPGAVEGFLHAADQQTQDRVVPPGHAADVVAATGLCARGQTVTVDFTAPAAGTYPYLCSVAGHGATMRGLLIVRARATASGTSKSTYAGTL